jgi:hypothetical protein
VAGESRWAIPDRDDVEEFPVDMVSLLTIAEADKRCFLLVLLARVLTAFAISWSKCNKVRGIYFERSLFR